MKIAKRALAMGVVAAFGLAAYGPANSAPVKDAQSGTNGDRTAYPSVATIKGDCRLTLPGQDLTIRCDTITYLNLPASGRIVFQAMIEGGAWSFSGAKDGQPDPAHYHLDVDSIQGPADGEHRTPASGACDVKLSADHKAVKALACVARTQGAVFGLSGSGKAETIDLAAPPPKSPKAN